MRQEKWDYFGLTDPKYRKKKFVPLYGVFKIENGVLLGFTEHSFSMSWSEERVRLWSLDAAQLYAKKYKGSFIYRLTRKSPDAKIRVDFKERQEELKANRRKYIWRNIKFYYAGDLLVGVK